jgi:hypothetical protein
MTSDVTSVSSSTSSQLLIAADGSRTSLTIQNTDAFDLFCLLDETGPATTAIGGFTFSRQLNAVATLTPPESYSAVYGIWSGDGSGGATLTAITNPVSDGNSAISTYGQLKTAIANWLRPGSTPTADMLARIPQYIGLAEVMIRRELHLRSLDQVDASLSISGGQASVPTGFQAVLSLTLKDEPYNQITALPLDQVRALASQPGRTKPHHYAVSGGIIYFDFAGDAEVELIFRRGVTPLTNDSDTNWILAAHPDVYLYGALLHADRRLIGPRLSEWKAGFGEALDSIQRLERNVHADIIIPMPNGYVA